MLPFKLYYFLGALEINFKSQASSLPITHCRLSFTPIKTQCQPLKLLLL